jgi:hypothetical protein
VPRQLEDHSNGNGNGTGSSAPGARREMGITPSSMTMTADHGDEEFEEY